MECVVDTDILFLADVRVMISAANALAVVADPKATHIIRALQQLVSHEQITVRHAGMQAKGRLEAKAESYDDLADATVKKTLTVEIVEAREIAAADANGVCCAYGRHEPVRGHSSSWK
jgi:predicted aldo/keto reductase-like oxidoreductase